MSGDTWRWDGTRWTELQDMGLKSTNVRPFQLDLSTVWYVGQADFDRWNRRLAPRANDILLTREAPMGFACLVPDSERMCLTQRLVLIRTDSRFVLPEYLMSYLNSPLFQSQLDEAQRGLTSRHIRVGDLPSFMAPLAPRAEQAAIVDKLRRIRRLHAQLGRVNVDRVEWLKDLVPAALAEISPP